MHKKEKYILLIIVIVLLVGVGIVLSEWSGLSRSTENPVKSSAPELSVEKVHLSSLPEPIAEWVEVGNQKVFNEDFSKVAYRIAIPVPLQYRNWFSDYLLFKIDLEESKEPISLKKLEAILNGMEEFIIYLESKGKGQSQNREELEEFFLALEQIKKDEHLEYGYIYFLEMLIGKLQEELVADYAIVLNDEVGESYDHIREHKSNELEIHFTPDGRTVVYTVRDNGNNVVVVDGEEVASLERTTNYDAVFIEGFNDDGEVKYRVVQKDGPVRHFIGTEEVVQLALEEEDSRATILNPDESVLGHIEKLQYGMKLVLDGSDDWYRLKGPFTAPNQQHIVYTAHKHDKAFIIFDGIKSSEYDDVNNFTFSSSGDHYAYVARKGNQYFIVLDGSELVVEAYPSELTFTPDGTEIAYLLTRRTEEPNESIVVGTAEGKPYETIVSRRFFFHPTTQEVVYVAEQDGKQFVVMGDTEYPAYDGVSTPVVSPDGSSLAYLACRDGDTSAEREKEILERWEYDLDSRSRSTVSQLSCESGGGRRFTVFNGNASEEYDYVWGPKFSEDGSELIYAAQSGRDIWKILEKVVY